MKTKKILAALTALACCTACAGQSSDPAQTAQGTGQITDENSAVIQFSPGTYEASSEGHHGEITVSMTFDEKEIKDCQVTKFEDTHVIGDPASEIITENAVKYQTGNLDSVTGATLSSMALIRNIKDCIRQAGVDPATLPEMPEASELSHETEEYDIVVVGAGTAGITAAIAAATEEDGKTQSDLNILLLERMPFAGGSFIVSGAGLFSISGTEQHKDGTFNVIDEDTWVDYLNFRSDNDAAGITNEGLQRKVYQEMDAAEKMMMEAGAPITMEDIYYGVPMDPRYPKADNNALAAIGFNSPLVDKMMSEYAEKAGHSSVPDAVGVYFIDTLKSFDNIDLRLNTRAEKILTKNGSVTGVSVTEKNFKDNTYSTYDILAKKVILATGSPQLNRELMEKYDPEFVKAYAFSEAGQTGDGIVMLEEAGLDPVIQGYGGMCYNGVSMQYGMEDYLALTEFDHMVVNKNGERYYDEAMTAPYDTGRNTAAQPDNTGYMIIDSTSPFYGSTNLIYHEARKDPQQTIIDYLIDNGWAYKADTLEQLADQIKVDKTNFLRTAETWNKAANGEIEDPMIAAPERITPLAEEGPYYAIKLHAFRVESYVSLATENGSSQIVNKSGETIDNLYGAGTLIVSNLYYDNYFNYCGGVTTGLVMGYIAGNEAQAAISGE